MLRRLLACVFLALALPLAAVAATPDFPALTGRVVDQAGLIDAGNEAAISGKLQALEAATTDQLVVVTLTSLGGFEIADYGYQLGRAWGIGQKGKDNGVLLIVAPNERKVRIEVGYGLEGTLTDALSSLILNTVILPRFKAGDMQGGIVAGVDALIDGLTTDTMGLREQAKQPAGDGNPDDWVPYVIVALVGIHFVLSMMSSLVPSSWRRRWGWRRFVATHGSLFSGGGSSGGSSGGFSGGGGSFGGGGSSGRW
jgi:uncharacterized protein